MVRVADVWCACHYLCDTELRTTTGEIYYDMEDIPDELLFSNANYVVAERDTLVIMCNGLKVNDSEKELQNGKLEI